MFRNLRNTIVSLLGAALLLVVPMAVPAMASAASIQGNLCGGASLKLDSNTSCASTSTATNNLNSFITKLVNVFSVVVGVVAVVMIIFGGFRYITSGGDSGNISNAKNTIIYAIIGLVIVALAQFIVQFVLNRASNGL